MSADPTGLDRYPTRILCPTDFTEFSRRALEYAIALARPVKGAITLLHVRRPRRPGADPERPLGGDAAGERSARRGSRPDAAFREAGRRRSHDAFPVPFIVMGSHGRHGLERWILGSYADRVLWMAPCPVLVMGSAEAATCGRSPVRIEEILCAASASERAPRTANYARCVAARAGARLAG